MRKIALFFGIIFCSHIGFSQTFPQAEQIEQDSLFQPFQRNLSDSAVLIREPNLEELSKWGQFKSKLHYGGNAWLSYFGGLYLDLTPTLAYELNKKGTMAGISLAIVNLGYSQIPEEKLAIGPRVFVRQGIWRSLFAHAEIEAINASRTQFNDYVNNNPTNPDYSKTWRVSPLIGLGFYQGGGKQQSGSFISVLYNLNNSGYVSPQSIFGRGSLYVFRVGFLI